MDSNYSQNVHGTRPELADLVDDEWMNDRIIFMELETQSLLPEVREDLNEESLISDELKWTDLGLQETQN